MLEREKMDTFKGKHPPSSNMDTFEYFRWMIKAGMEFNSAYPRRTQAVSRVLLGEGLYYGKNFADYREKTTQALTAMIKQAIEQGEVDPSVDVELGAFREDAGKDRQAVIRHGIRIAENGIRIRGKHLGEFTTPTPKEQND